MLNRLNAGSDQFTPFERAQLAGLAHFYGGNLSTATTLFLQAAEDEDDLEALLAPFYLLLCQDSPPALAATVQRAALTRAVAYTKSGEMDEVPLYYAGQIFYFNGMQEAAVRCFGRCGTMLPALYMEVQVLAGSDGSHNVDPYVSFLLKEEIRQTAIGIPGFLTDNHHVDPDTISATASLETAMLHQAHIRELSGAIALVRAWLEAYQAQHGSPHPALSHGQPPR
jgi:hypothetical protein